MLRSHNLPIAPMGAKPFLLLLLLFFASCCSAADAIPSSERSRKAISRVTPSLEQALAKQGLSLGAPVFIRIFKKTKKLEVWLEKHEGVFEHFKTYKICTYSGRLGPKTRQGDWQAPEGFYYVPPARLNPWSRYHLAFNLGYPNKYDRYHGRTGSALMVHGKCVSIGCFAMTNKRIDEIYTLMDAAYKKGQPFVRVHIFPFKMTDKNMEWHDGNKWLAFWQNLKTGYLYFEKHHRPPNVELQGGRYVFE